MLFIQRGVPDLKFSFPFCFIACWFLFCCCLWFYLVWALVFFFFFSQKPSEHLKEDAVFVEALYPSLGIIWLEGVTDLHINTAAVLLESDGPFVFWYA